MPSTLDTAIRNARRGIDQRESPIRRQLRDAYDLTIQRIEAELEIVARRLATFDVPDSWLDSRGRFTRYGEVAFRQQFLRRLLPDAEREFARFTDDGLRILRSGQAAAVSGGAAEAVELMEAAGIDVGFGGRVNTRAVENLVSAFDPASPLRDVLDSYGTNGTKVIERLLIQGLATGEGPRQVVKRIRSELTSGSTKARLDSLVRTEMMRAFRASTNEQYARMSNVIQGYRWSCAKGLRTCLACLAKDGEVTKEPQSTFHIACRCVSTPVPKGSTYRYQTGSEWLKEQPEDKQRSMFPSQVSFDAFQRGDLGLKDFIGHRRSTVWGSSIRERSGSEAIRSAR